MSHMCMDTVKQYNYEVWPDNLYSIAGGRGEAIMLVKLSIILVSNSHNFTYYAHRFYLLFSKLCLVYYAGILASPLVGG